MRATASFLLALSLLSSSARAEEPYLVRDINVQPAGVGSRAAEFVGFSNGRAAFVANDGLTGRELWGSDGTTAGTILLADTCAGECGGAPRLVASFPDFAVFAALSPDLSGDSLWRTDGTPTGTVRLTAAPVQLGSGTAWVPEQRRFYFTVIDPEIGIELWVSDGAPGGARLVRDLNPGVASGDPRWLTPFRGKLYFVAEDDVAGSALWSTDGTSSGTRRVRDPWPGSGDRGGLTWLRATGSRLHFFAESPGAGLEPWQSDGTTAGTAQVADLTPGRGSTLVFDLVVAGSRVYFIAQTGAGGPELWTGDGTRGGTRQLTNFPAPQPFVGQGRFLELPRDAPAGAFLFRANDGSHGIELWSTAGTRAGTRLLRDICPGACSGIPDWLLRVAGRYVFPGRTPAEGHELWVSDGTPARTRMAADLCPGPCSGSPFAPLALGGRIFFAAPDAAGVFQAWRTDGTPRGTVQISAFAAGFGPSGLASSFEGVALPNAVLFVASDPEHGGEVWSTDGTRARTRLVRDIDESMEGGSYPQLVGEVAGRLFFFADDGEHGHEPWVSDGTAAGTRMTQELLPADQPRGAAGPFQAAALNGRLLYTLALDGSPAALWQTDGKSTGQLSPEGLFVAGPLFAGDHTVRFPGSAAGQTGWWESDGTRAGTRLLVETPGSVMPLAEVAGDLYYFAGQDLWASDGTPEGTRRLREQLGGTGTRLAAVHDGILYFFAQDSGHGQELWQSDGTAVGTALVLDLEPGFQSFSPTLLASIGGRLLLSGEGATTAGLWESDGTPEGTLRIDGTIAARPIDAPPPLVHQGRLYFSRQGESFEHQLWQTDGTAAGTGPVVSGAGGPLSEPVALAALGERLYVTTRAGDAALWETDGSAAGTRRVRALEPGSAEPFELVRAGDRIFFRSGDRASGVELWAIEEEP